MVILSYGTFCSTPRRSLVARTTAQVRSAPISITNLTVTHPGNDRSRPPRRDECSSQLARCRQTSMKLSLRGMFVVASWRICVASAVRIRIYPVASNGETYSRKLKELRSNVKTLASESCDSFAAGSSPGTEQGVFVRLSFIRQDLH